MVIYLPACLISGWHFDLIPWRGSVAVVVGTSSSLTRRLKTVKMLTAKIGLSQNFSASPPPKFPPYYEEAQNQAKTYRKNLPPNERVAKLIVLSGAEPKCDPDFTKSPPGGSGASFARKSPSLIKSQKMGRTLPSNFEFEQKIWRNLLHGA